MARTCGLLGGCTKSTATPAVPGTGTSSSSFAEVRFVAGSPDANGGSAVDFTINGTVQTAGQAQAYGTVSTYNEVTAGAVTAIGANDTGTATPVLSATSFTPVAGTNYTIVLAGRAASTSLQFLIFTDAAYSSSSTQAVINAHDASPAAATAGITTFNFGSFTPGQTNFANIETATFPSGAGTIGTGVISAALPAAAATAPGIEFYAVPSTQTPSAASPPSSAQTLLPSAVVAADTTNILPDTTIATPFTHLSLFVIDASTALGYELVGASD